MSRERDQPWPPFSLRKWLIAVLLIGAAGAFVLAVGPTPDWARAAGYAVAITSVLAAIIFAAPSTPVALRVLFLGSGLLLVLLWALVSLAGMPIQPRVVFDSILITGPLLIAAAVALGSEARLAWIIGIVAASALWLTVAAALLGFLFDPAIPLRAVVIALGLVWLAGASWAIYAMVESAREYGADGLLNWGRGSDLALVGVLGGLAALYGLWYGFIVGPTDKPPALEAVVTVEDMGMRAGHYSAALTVSISNPSDTRVTLLGSTYEVFGAEEQEAQEFSFACRLDSMLRKDDKVCVGDDGLETGAVVNSGTTSIRPGSQPYYSLVQAGRLWPVGEFLDPGSSEELRVLLLIPMSMEWARVEGRLVYARTDRLAVAPDADDDLDSTCTEGSTVDEPFRTRYRRLAGDPFSAVMAALDPVRLEVAVIGEHAGITTLVCTAPAGSYKPLVVTTGVPGQTKLTGGVDGELGIASTNPIYEFALGQGPTGVKVDGNDP